MNKYLTTKQAEYLANGGGGGSTVEPYTSNPEMDGTASPGSSVKYARGDHVHPKDSSIPEAATAAPIMDGTAAVGTSSKYAKEDHVHPHDTGVNAYRTAAIPYGEVDSTSTSTVFTATVTGITAYYDGVAVMLKNGVVTSATNFTININGLGAKPVYNNMATGNPITPTNPTRDTTIFNINYTMLLIYSSTIVSGGGWICYRGYDANTNTIGYQLRTNSTILKISDQSRYYRMMFTSADGTHWVPANTAKDNSATSAKTVNQRPIDPFGRMIYYGANTNLAAEANVAAAYCWDQYTFSLGYSFNWTGAALTLTTSAPVYLKCAPQTNGSAIIDSTTPIVQALPSSNDGKIYIFLGIAYSATNIEIVPNHPVYYHDGTGIRIWTGEAIPTVPSITSTTATLASGNWSSNTQSVSVTGVTSTNNVIVAAAPTSMSDYADANVRCTAQSSGTLTFTCETTPTNNITVNVMIFS